MPGYHRVERKSHILSSLCILTLREHTIHSRRRRAEPQIFCTCSRVCAKVRSPMSELSVHHVVHSPFPTSADWGRISKEQKFHCCARDSCLHWDIRYVSRVRAKSFYIITFTYSRERCWVQNIQGGLKVSRLL